MVGMGRPGTSPKSESFTCNWSDRLLPVNLYSEPVSSQWHSSSVKPHHTGQAACKASCSLLSSCLISAPTGAMPFLPAPHTHPITEPVTGNSCVRSLLCPQLGEGEKPVHMQLLKEQMGNKGTDKCNISFSNVSPLKYTQLFCLVFLLCTPELTFPICLCTVF